MIRWHSLFFIAHSRNYTVKIITLAMRTSLIAQLVKSLPAVQETWVQFQDQEDPLEKEMATHSSVLSWRIPMDRGAWQATVHWITRVGQDLVNKPLPPKIITNFTKLLVFKIHCLFLKFILSFLFNTQIYKLIPIPGFFS